MLAKAGAKVTEMELPALGADLREGQKTLSAFDGPRAHADEARRFHDLLSQSLREAVTGQLMRVEIQTSPPPQPGPLPAMEEHKADPVTGEDEMALAAAGAQTLARHGIGVSAGAAVGALEAPPRNPKDPTSWGKVGRNESCPCGSGKKFKHCHGKYA